jgi:hypothetical protein
MVVNHSVPSNVCFIRIQYLQNVSAESTAKIATLQQSRMGACVFCIWYRLSTCCLKIIAMFNFEVTSIVRAVREGSPFV